MNDTKNSALRVCVFCGSSPLISSHFLDAARAVALVLCDLRAEIVYGGGSVGMMGALADQALKLGGRIRGVIPGFMVEREWAHPQVTILDVVNTMAERKARMIETSDVILALPGGIGTLDEFFEAATLKQLGCLHSPLLLYNVQGYFEPLMQMQAMMARHHFLTADFGVSWQLIEDADSLRCFLNEWDKEKEAEVPNATI